MWSSISWFLIVGTFSTFFLIHFWQKGFKIDGISDALPLTICPIFLIFGIGINVLAYQAQTDCLNAAGVGDINYVEGPISNLHTDPRRESFEVNGIKFEYHEFYGNECGYHQSVGKSQGIWLKEGDIVRITYWNGRILRLEWSRPSGSRN
jgi:hypothetical protein